MHFKIEEHMKRERIVLKHINSQNIRYVVVRVTLKRIRFRRRIEVNSISFSFSLVNFITTPLDLLEIQGKSNLKITFSVPIQRRTRGIPVALCTPRHKSRKSLHR